jgi:hypothetical protein
MGRLYHGGRASVMGWRPPSLLRSSAAEESGGRCSGATARGEGCACQVCACSKLCALGINRAAWVEAPFVAGRDWSPLIVQVGVSFGVEVGSKMPGSGKRKFPPVRSLSFITVRQGRRYRAAANVVVRRCSTLSMHVGVSDGVRRRVGLQITCPSLSVSAGVRLCRHYMLWPRSRHFLGLSGVA